MKLNAALIWAMVSLALKASLHFNFWQICKIMASVRIRKAELFTGMAQYHLNLIKKTTH